jgi:hypothetical protein
MVVYFAEECNLSEDTHLFFWGGGGGDGRDATGPNYLQGPRMAMLSKADALSCVQLSKWVSVRYLGMIDVAFPTD